MTTVKPTPPYHARYTLDRVSGIWEVEVAQVPDVHTFGRTLDKAEENVREALARSLKTSGSALLMRHEYHLGPAADEVVMASIDARAQANETSERAATLTREAAQKITGELGLSLRDAARVLQLSHQRVSQILTQNVLDSMAASVRSRISGGLQLPPQR